jgi:hypothetical protein
MSITLDDNAVDVFKLYDEMTEAYSKDIEGYKTLLKAIEAMIAQKEEMLRDIKDKTVALLKQSIGSSEIALPGKPSMIIDYEYAIDAGAESENLELQITQTENPPIKERKTRSRKQKKEVKTRKDKVSLKSLADGKTEPESKSPRSKKSEKPVKAEKEIKCLYHPESPAVDMQRQLCSSCRWKLRSNGLTEYDKDPTVVAFLKGEIKSIPNVGQPMCPIHPDVPAYNKKTGLCQRCQSKARAIGIIDRHPTEKELKGLRPA